MLKCKCTKNSHGNLYVTKDYAGAAIICKRKPLKEQRDRMNPFYLLALKNLITNEPALSVCILIITSNIQSYFGAVDNQN